jgi:hypothetical protein
VGVEEITFHFPTPPQSGKPEVLLQIAVRLTVEVVKTKLV